LIGAGNRIGRPGLAMTFLSLGLVVGVVLLSG